MLVLSTLIFGLLGLWVIALAHFVAEGAFRWATPLVAGLVAGVLAWAMVGDLTVAGAMFALAGGMCYALLGRRAAVVDVESEMAPIHAAIDAPLRLAA